MRYVIFAVLLAGCVTSGSVERAQEDSLECWQEARRDPDMRDKCERLDLRAQQLEARHERQRQALLRN